jgi:hypothetical protein
MKQICSQGFSRHISSNKYKGSLPTGVSPSYQSVQSIERNPAGTETCSFGRKFYGINAATPLT